MSESINCLRATPSTQFSADPLVSSLFSKEDDYFGLVLVTGWPPNFESMNQPYQAFLKQVRKCFAHSDLESRGIKPPSVYLYPLSSLHITIATLCPVQKKRVERGEEYYNDLQNKYVELTKAASLRDEWPKPTRKEPLDLQVESVQLCQKAGILLWKDVSGSIHAMRKCLKEEALHRGLEIYSIPNIIHSTFLRFAQEPSENSGRGEDIQQKFQTIVAPNVGEIFGSNLQQPVISLSCRPFCKLVCETTPYMHIPDDEQHVFLQV
ncbi:hypothetical protein HJC23_004853 [Cyclotella cryptica]|uniref:Protein kinase A anchor protein nuclear localisation signal domain-containing protein n=1 Tax=Cyclotella cryptica TaxID=29204 RepID=A0ABD3P2G1_9STRA|eukprot:CCRYP_018290-RA/>CCRYP_018290-RA protein AED:0.11 eAED:0.11 QI:0/-1/0/1/-1/1/1/0/264